MKKRILELENRKSDMVNAFETRWRKREKKTDFEAEIKKDFEDEHQN